MAGRPTKLNDETQAIILEWIGKGAYDWVAAQAAGIDPSTFKNWMKRDEDIYIEFQRQVRMARARVRAEVEAQVRKEAPFNWLRFGPGRERPGEPGWTDSTAVTNGEGGELVIKVEYVDAPSYDNDVSSRPAGEDSGSGEDPGEAL